MTAISAVTMALPAAIRQARRPGPLFGMPHEQAARRLRAVRMRCPRPVRCPFKNDQRFNKVCILVGMLMALMAAVALGAIVKGKDGVITGSVCTAMTATVTSVLLGGYRRMKRNSVEDPTGNKGGDSNAI